MSDNEREIRSVLYIDIGSVNTRVCLFDKNENHFSFHAAASAKTSYQQPDRSEYLGIVEAVAKLERATKRKFLDKNQNLIMPMALDGTGIDQVAASFSCVEDPRVAIMGLTQQASSANLRTLLAYTGLVPSIEINADDGDKISDQLDALLTLSPRIVLLAGGKDGGAEKAVYRLGETLMLACRSLPREQRPLILFLGNSVAAEQVEQVLSRLTEVSSAANVIEAGSGIDSSINGLVNLLRRDAETMAPGIRTLREKTKSSVVPGAFAFGRSIRLMSRLIRRNQYVLGVDIGARRTISAVSRNLQLQMRTLSVGLGSGIREAAERIPLAKIQSWISYQIKADEIRDYILNKSFYPDLIPANHYSAEIEHAIARCILQECKHASQLDEVCERGSLSTVLLSGALLRNVEDPADALRIGMDSMVAAGSVDYLLDMNGLSHAIGVLAHVNPELTSQVMNVSTYLLLGKVIRPVYNHDLKHKSLLTISLRDDAGNVRQYEVPPGRIYRIPLELGKNYELNFVKVARGVTVPGVKTWTPLGFKSGCLGLVFDCRKVRDGVLVTSKDRAMQIALLEEWKETLGKWTGAEKESGNE